jgi:hypothetical protein
VIDARRENELALARLLGISEEEASTRLEARVAVTHGGGVSELLASEIRALVERTLTVSNGEKADVEIIVGAEARGCAADQRFVSLNPNTVTVSSEGPSRVEPCHGLLRSLAACYAAGSAICHAIRRSEALCPEEPLNVSFEDLGVDNALLGNKIHLSDAALVGAGAIGNAFLWAIRHLDIDGELTIVDPKHVGAGNVNRCLYFDMDSIGKEKALELSTRARTDVPSLSLVDYFGTFDELVTSRGRVRRAIVAVDSRRARRSIQSSLPIEVLDASTTAADEVIVHAHRYPSAGACLACIYHHIPQEHARETHIADALGVAVTDVQNAVIDTKAADLIAAKYTNLNPPELVGIAYDSLFKALCGQQALESPSGQQVLAPFAFVSALAGALLAVELTRFDATRTTRENGSVYFATSPWRPPNRLFRRTRQRRADCTFCSRPESALAMKAVWGAELGIT